VCGIVVFGDCIRMSRASCSKPLGPPPFSAA
jgi:hypothetical protein